MTANFDDSDFALRGSLFSRLLGINLAVAILVLLANGSALVIGLSGKAPELAGHFANIVVILASAAAVAISAALALAKPQHRKNVLSFHPFVFVAAALADLVFGLGLTAQVDRLTLPTIKTSWSVGWLTALGAYATYLAARVLLAEAGRTSIAVRYAYLWVGALFLAVDVFVFTKLAASSM
jgi:hypothetical protein